MKVLIDIKGEVSKQRSALLGMIGQFCDTLPQRIAIAEATYKEVSESAKGPKGKKPKADSQE